MGGRVMSLAVIDAREWQNRFDLETGQPEKTMRPWWRWRLGFFPGTLIPGMWMNGQTSG